ncbi:PREDICTED: putative pectinesterase/pectinesterase inhibitor 22 [Brassica oleracea var. oleracea]|uniref:Pectinesterase n=1 Tax=Brassica oleracea var. oleracea TaxID=109376 RepID=A0A0D3CMI6_BRAOL|nr:PREDICTED: putative pectinesterase/pectinesterase inhibitor 22 [Brassica oleracea var. oleracea]
MAQNSTLFTAISLLVFSIFSHCQALTLEALCESTPHPPVCKSVLPVGPPGSVSGFASIVIIKSLEASKHLLASFDQHHPTTGPLDDCQLLAGLTVDQLTRVNVIKETVLGTSEVNDLLTLLSAAITNYETCLGSFHDATGESSENFVKDHHDILTRVSDGIKLISVSLALSKEAWPIASDASVTKPPPRILTEDEKKSSSPEVSYVKVTKPVSGRGFIARDITFRNTAGPHNRQAVALRVDSDQSAFFRCSMEGYQDTLYAHSLRQFYRECEIYGTIDFIFGNGAAVLQNCKIYTRVPLQLQKVTITAQGRKSPNQNTGFVIMNSYVLATQPTYLGRPWKLYSRTVYMNTYMSQLVQPRGWLEWFGNFALDTLWYGEYNNIGPGWRASGRVKWPGYHIMDKRTAMSFTVGSFIDGRRWLPATGVTFTAGLAN